jgi:parallel beta-helix repeat protein
MKQFVLSFSFRSGMALFALVGVMLSGLVMPASALATITVPDNYSTIQAAVNAASVGDTVFVRAGVYPEHVTINKALTLTGANRASTIVDGGGSGEGLYVSANGVTISGFTVRNAVTGIHYSHASNGRIEDVLATANTSVGVFLDASPNNTIVNSVAAKNAVSGFSLGDQGSHDVTFQNVTAFGNTSEGIVGYSGTNTIHISDSTFHHNGRALVIGFSQDWTITNTSLYANNCGIYFDTASYVTVRNSDFHANIQGVRFTGFYSDDNLFEGNRFYDNTSAGLSFNNDAHNNIIRGNDFYNNGLGIEIKDLVNRQSSDNTFYQNIFLDNTVNAQAAATGYSNTWDNGYPAGGDYWDDYSGADAYNSVTQTVPNRDGIGDTPYVITASTNVDNYPMMGLFADNNGPKSAGSTVTFTVSTLLDRAFTYTWDFGDGAQGSNATTVTHAYAANGVYTATVSATDGAVQLTGVTHVVVGPALIVPDSYSTIQAAVNAASVGDTVFVRAGIYPEHVTINKALTLTGANRASTIVDGGGSGEGLYVSANGVVISGFTVRSAVTGIHYYHASNGRIEDVLATANTSVGIFLDASPNNTVVNSVAAKNAVSGFSLGDQGSHDVTFQNVTAFGNTSEGLVGYSGSNTIHIIDSTFHHNGRALVIGFSQGWTVTNTSLYANNCGIYFDTASYVTVQNSDFRANIQGARFTGFASDYNVFEGNRFYANTSAGLSFNNDAHNNTIRSNDFYNNGMGVEIKDTANRQSYNNTFYQNIFMNNTVNAQAAAIGYSNTWDNGYPAGGNYWGDYSGVDAFSAATQTVAGRDGIGDTPYVITASTNIDRYPLMGLFVTNNGPKPAASAISFTVSTLLDRAFTYTWDFGDGILGSGAPTTHAYPSAGSNYTAAVTASDGAAALTATTSIHVQSANANLSGLVFSTGALSPAFVTGTTLYTQSVAYAVSSLTVTPSVADSAATVTVNGDPVTSGAASGAIPLVVGPNTITTLVTAEDGTTTKTYTVTVTRADVGVPVVDSFSAPATSKSLAIPITAFTASDNLAVTGYMITTSNTAPAVGASGWSGTAPTTFTVTQDGTYTLYPWAKDADGNVSAQFGSPVNVKVDTKSYSYLPLIRH